MKKRSVLLLAFLIACSSKQSEERLLVQASRLDSIGQFKMAIRVYDQILSQDSTNISALLDRAYDKAELGDREGQIKDLQRVVNLQPQNTLALYNLGIAYGNINKFPESIAAFNRAVATKGGESISIDWKQNDLTEDDNYGFDVPIADIKLERGIVYYYCDSVKKAYHDLTFCINNKHALRESYYYRSITYLKSEMLEQACKDAKMSALYGMKEANLILEKYCK